MNGRPDLHSCDGERGANDGSAGCRGARGSGDAGTDLIDEADGIHAILRDEVTAAAAEPSEHRGPPTLHAQWRDLSDLIPADSPFFIKNNPNKEH